MSSGPHHDAARRAATSVRHRVDKHIAWNDRGVEIGIVRGLTLPTQPMQVELVASSVLLEEGIHLFLSQWVRWFDLNYQIQVDDALLLTRLPDESYVAFDVRSDRDVDAGIRPSRPPATPTGDMRPAEASSETGLVTAAATPVANLGDTPTVTLTWNHHIVSKLQVFDASGNPVGYVPVFQDLP